MKATDINIAISGDEMTISEENTTGEEYHIADGSLANTIEQITTCLADYLYNTYSDPIEQPPELKQWQKDIMERNCIMSRAEMQEFLKPKNDPVNHPSHYTDGKIEVIDFIEDKKLPFHLGNVVKYVSRAGKKDKTKTIEDLKKAQWYLNRYIQLLSSEGDTDGDRIELFSGYEKVGEIPVNKETTT